MERIVILSGAGLSAESGLGTFRDTGGLWSRYDLNEVATPQGFAANPALVHDFYNARRANCLDAQPNTAHAALATLQGKWPAHVTMITQNIDDLLTRAGAGDVIHMHGQINRALCAACGARWDAPRVMDARDPCPACNHRTTRPDVVWFGEIPYHMDRIEAALEQADLFVSVGTSGNVYPAAGFVQIAKTSGASTLELNLDPSDSVGLFDAARFGPATQTVPNWVDEILRRDLPA